MDRVFVFSCLWLTALSAAASPARRPNRGLEKDAYVLVRGGHWLTTNESIEVVLAIQRKFSGDFLWFRRGGRERIVLDPEILDRARAAFEPLRETEPARADLARRQETLDAEERSLDAEQEDLERAEESGDEEAAESDRADRETRRRDLEARMHDVEARERALDAEDRELDRREDALERAAEERLWRLIDRAIAEGKAEPLDPGR